ncbi:NADH-quinone oxidoreductase subunit M [Georgenia faecalis]|uniref:NADH-quinone oxidoreductase subunit M n=1 Tax=Georgenia faecalis TaxID=2483799 RepID=A0ABV9D8B0_9MICO|nr:NADH-quinone oxidoreductase subunit M [Georgenia faecalis]
MQNTTELPWLSILIVVPLVAAAVLWLVRPLHRVARPFGVGVALLVLVGAVVMATQFDLAAAGQQQLTEQLSWIPQLGVSYALGVNGLGLAMVLLSVFLVPIAIAAGWREHERALEGVDVARRQAGFVALVLALEAMMIAVFAARDVFLFYVLFEAMLIPVYFLIGAYGGPRRRHAATKFLLYSLAGGLIMLVGVIALGIAGPGGPEGFLIDSLVGADLGLWAERWIFLAFFVAFAVKAPMWPVHTWLPDAAQQASPGTSALLVGVLDKVGTFGMLALCLPLFPEASRWAAPAIIVLAVVSILYGAIVAVGQRDLMRLVAFTSVSHFGFIVLGIFVRDEVAMTGAMLYMVAHGVSTAALFLFGGFLTQRGGTQDIASYSGMRQVTPVLAGSFLIAGLATLSLPGLSGFVPEYLVLLGTFRVSPVAAVAAVLAVVVAALYILLPYQRMFTGRTREELAATPDLGGRERWAVVAPLVAAMLVLGIYPAPVLDAVRPVAEELAIEHVDTTTSADPGADEAAATVAEGSGK